jgi:hypothetical protein
MFKAQFEMDFALITIFLIINLINRLFDFFVFFLMDFITTLDMGKINGINNF